MRIISSKTRIPDELIEPAIDQIPLSDYWQAARQGKWLVLTLVIIAMITTFVIQKQQAMYHASTSVVLSASALEVFSSQTAVEQVLKSDNALEAIIAKAPVNYSPQQLRGRITVEFVSGTSLVNINVVDVQAKRAKKIADLAAARFVAATKGSDTSYMNMQSLLKTTNEELQWMHKLLYRNAGTTKENPIEAGTKNTDAEINEIKAELARLNDSGMDSTNNEIRRFLLNQRLLALEEREPNLIGQRLSILAQEQALITQKQSIQVELNKVRATRVLAPAATPATLSTPGLGKNIVVAGIGAFIAGIALAMAINPNNEKD